MGVSECEDLFPSGFSDQPWLMQLHGGSETQEFMDPYNRCIVERNIPQFTGKLCLGFYKNWLLLADKLTKETFFLHRTLDPKLKVCLPSLCGVSFNFLGSCVISSSPASKKCVVSFVGRRKDFILYCRPKLNVRWTKVSLSIHDSENPDDQHRFTGQVVRFKGKIYILHGSLVAFRVVVIDEDSLLNGDCSWTIIQMPNRIDAWHHLVVSGNEMFSVLVATSDLRRGFPAYCTVHRLETSDQTWERVESIGGCVFFLGGIQNSALTATQAGTQRDCIYVVNQNYGWLHGEGVYKICMQDQIVSLSLSLKKPIRTDWICKLCWLMPTKVSRKSKRETLSFTHSIGSDKSDRTHVHEKEEKRNIDISRPWADLPIELVQLLLSRLNLVDCLRLSSICKAWNTVSSHIQDAMAYPWLMYSTNDSCSWRLFDPVYGKEYFIDNTWLGFGKNLTFHYSKDGWVLASKENKYLFLINPLTREFISLPAPDFDIRRSTAMSLSSSPANSDCIVFVVYFNDLHVLEISTWSRSQDEWNKLSFNNELGYYVPCNPVFTWGELYCYKVNGELSVYNPTKKTLQTLEIKAPIEIVVGSDRIIQCHFMESRGDLITVFREHAKDRLRIFKLDRPQLVWREVFGVEDVTIFLNNKTSLAVSCPEKRCRDLIYFSGFADEHLKSNASYTVETNEYYPEDCYHIREPMNCIWVEPRI
ncbi:F-box protein family-like [Rhynchospora pubera]|uniref:F-box protein family-like n=1 Tax=Rhynchospora pubera TaxID=906938 RepID=A0AAV8GY88_9POAL|nr:F-box protein family-like [Rhynchospora pubera]